MKYRSKPTTIDAMQVPPQNDLMAWGGFAVWLGAGGPWILQHDNRGVLVTTISGNDALARPGDWVIKEPDGRHHYPCAPEIFTARYDRILDGPMVDGLPIGDEEEIRG